MACRYIPDPSSCRPTYLVIFKGDDTNFPGNQRIDLVIDTELDLTGIKAHFRFMDFVQDFNEIPADKRLQIVIPHEKTSAFPLGSADASLTFEDSGGKIRTVSNRIHVVVTNSVREAYNNQDTQSITVTVTGTVTWDMIHGKPNASDSNPLMDGEPSSGESSDYSRGDHRHPSDTSKRGLEDLDVRGAPQGEGSWFVLDDDRILTYRPDEDEWREEIASVYKIIKSDGQYELEDDLGELIGTFTLTESGGYSAIVGEQQIHVVGYVDTLAKVSEIPTRTNQLTNDSGFITSADVHGDYIEDANGNKIEADLSVRKVTLHNTWYVTDTRAGVSYSLRPEDSFLLAEYLPDDPSEGDHGFKIELNQTGENDYTGLLTDYIRYQGEWAENETFEVELLNGATSATCSQYLIEYTNSAPTRINTTLATLLDLSNKKDKQTPVTSPTASGNATSFIDSISQDANGVITPTKKTIPTAAPSTSGAGGTAGLMSAADKEKLEGIATGATAVTVDTSLSDSSTNPVQNKAVTAALAQKASLTDLPYRLVEPGKWEFSGLPSGVTVVSMSYSNYMWSLELSDSTTQSASSYSGEDLIVEFYGGSSTITATRPSLPGHLCDRAGNRVEVSGDTTLTLPAANPGYLRDFLVRLEISGSTVPTITFAAPTGETLTYETDGDEFPVPDESGTWSYSFTENCVAHKFAVALKKVTTVTQGGS